MNATDGIAETSHQEGVEYPFGFRSPPLADAVGRRSSGEGIEDSDEAARSTVDG